MGRALFALVDGIDENAEYVQEATSPMNFSNIIIPGPLQAEHVTSTCQLGSASSLSPPLPLSQLHGPESNCAAQPRARSGIHVTRSRRGLAALDPAVSICGSTTGRRCGSTSCSHIHNQSWAQRRSAIITGLLLPRSPRAHWKIVVCPCKLR